MTPKTDYELPHGWQWARLGEVCDIQLGKMLSPKSRTGVSPQPYLRNANVQWARFELTDVAVMDFSPAERAKLALRRGDILVCEEGEPGRAAVWEGQITPCYYQKALHRLRPRHGLADAHFVMYQLWAGATSGEFSDANSQTTIAHLPAIRLAELELPLPPLPEQKRIAAILTEQMAAGERARTAIEGQLATINALPAALLRAAFSGGL